MTETYSLIDVKCKYYIYISFSFVHFTVEMFFKELILSKLKINKIR